MLQNDESVAEKREMMETNEDGKDGYKRGSKRLGCTCEVGRLSKRVRDDKGIVPL